MDERIDESLRIYNRQLTTQLRVKEEQFTDLQRRFFKLQDRFAELDYAFKKNLQLHQQQMIEIYDLRLREKELQKSHKDRENKLRSLEDQLLQVTEEKRIAEYNLARWKQALIDQKRFYEGRFAECVKEFKSKFEATEIAHRKILRETQNLTEKHIQELSERSKLNEKEAEMNKKKEIMLRGEVDVFQYRTEKLASLLQSSASGIRENLQAVCRSIAKVLRSLSTSCEDYDDRIKELNEELSIPITAGAEPKLIPDVDISDYEMLKSQNTVLREVVKKLKTQLTKVHKSEVMVANRLAEKREDENLRNEWNPSNPKDHTVVEKLETANIRGIEESESNNSKLINKRDNKGSTIISMSPSGGNNRVKAVETDKKSGIHSERRGAGKFNDEDSDEAHWDFVEGKGRVKKLKEGARRDVIKSFELNFEPLNSDRDDFALKNRQKKVQRNNGGCINGDKNQLSQSSRVELEPVESHLNSIRYKEYAISISKNQNLRIRHPSVPASSSEIFQFRSVFSEEEYQNLPIDEAVVYFDSGEVDADLPESKTINCAVQTLAIPMVNVFTQTTATKETLKGQANTGIKILNSEIRAIERSLRDLEKTVSEASQETLGHARSTILSTGQFLPSEQFFDCVKLLSEFKTT